MDMPIDLLSDLYELSERTRNDVLVVVLVGKRFPTYQYAVADLLRKCGVQTRHHKRVIAISVFFAGSERATPPATRPAPMVVHEWQHRYRVTTHEVVMDFSNVACLEVWPDQALDLLVFDYKVWGYFQNRRVCLPQYARMLKHGGRLLLPHEFVLPHSLWTRSQEASSAADHDEEHVYLSLDAIAPAVAQAVDVLAEVLPRHMGNVRTWRHKYHFLDELLVDTSTTNASVRVQTQHLYVPSKSKAQADRIVLYAHAFAGVHLHSLDTNTAFAVPSLNVLALALLALELFWDAHTATGDRDRQRREARWWIQAHDVFAAPAQPLSLPPRALSEEYGQAQAEERWAAFLRADDAHRACVKAAEGLYAAFQASLASASAQWTAYVRQVFGAQAVAVHHSGERPYPTLLHCNRTPKFAYCVATAHHAHGDALTPTASAICKTSADAMPAGAKVLTVPEAPPAPFPDLECSLPT